PARPAAAPPEVVPPRPPATAPVSRQETTRVLREVTVDRVETVPRPAGAADPPSPSAVPVSPPRPAAPAPAVAATVVRPAPPASPGRLAPVTRAAVRAPEQPTVHVHIGRIDVRLAPGARCSSREGR
ncbi:hypothetical protein ACSNN7_29075, partial [Micromonospora sp. URMC 105]